jgi:hypothetical protein
VIPIGQYPCKESTASHGSNKTLALSAGVAPVIVCTQEDLNPIILDEDVTKTKTLTTWANLLRLKIKLLLNLVCNQSLRLPRGE